MAQIEGLPLSESNFMTRIFSYLVYALNGVFEKKLSRSWCGAGEASYTGM